MRSFFDLNPTQREALRKGFLYGGLHLKSSVHQLKLKGAGMVAPQVQAYLQKLDELGANKQVVIHLLEVTSQISEEMSLSTDVEPSILPSSQPQIVMTSPLIDQSEYLISYKTMFHTLLSEAQESVWLSSYSYGYLSKSQSSSHSTFGMLSDALLLLKEEPTVQINLLLHLWESDDKDHIQQEMIDNLVSEFLSFWPQDHPKPSIYFDPSTHINANRPAALPPLEANLNMQHSKVIIIDEKKVLIGSANLSKAAYEKNLEVGCMIESQEQAKALIEHFNLLIEQGKLQELVLQSWWENPSELDLDSPSRKQALALIENHPDLQQSKPMIMRELTVEEDEYDPTLYWRTYKVALYFLPFSLIDNSGLKQSWQNEIQVLKTKGWFAALINHQDECITLSDQLSFHLQSINPFHN